MVAERFRLDLLLTTTELARATYYYQLKQLDKDDKDKALNDDIQAIFEEHKVNYGYRRVYLELRNSGYAINHKKVQRLIQILGLLARIRRRKRYKSYKCDVGKKAPNLIERAFEGAKPFEKCYTDVTEFALPNCAEKLYLSPVLDGYNSELLIFPCPVLPTSYKSRLCLIRPFLRTLTQIPFSIVTKVGNTGMKPIIIFFPAKAYVLPCLAKEPARTTV